MPQFSRLLVALLLPVLLPVLVSGCAAAIVGAAATGAGAAHDRRTVGAWVDDNRIELAAYDSINKDKELALENNVEVVSYNGLVLMIGETRTEELRARAEGKVQGIQGIKRIVNEIQVREKPGVLSSTHDKWITARVKTGLLDIVDMPEFDPSRVNVTTQADVVYLMGLLSQAEAERVVQIARTTPGVLRVVKVFEYTD